MSVVLAFHSSCIYKIPLHPKTPSSLALLKSRLVLPFWYQLTQVVLEKRPLNECNVVVVVVVLAFTAIRNTFAVSVCASQPVRNKGRETLISKK